MTACEFVAHSDLRKALQQSRSCSPAFAATHYYRFRMHSSSVLIVHPSADRFRLPDMMANGKLNNTRHYSLDSPSLTSPPGYNDPLMDQKPPGGLSMAMSMPSSTMSMPMSSPQFSSFNPHLVMAPSAPPGLLHIGKLLHCTSMLHARARMRRALVLRVLLCYAGV